MYGTVRCLWGVFAGVADTPALALAPNLGVRSPVERIDLVHAGATAYVHYGVHDMLRYVSP